MLFEKKRKKEKGHFKTILHGYISTRSLCQHLEFISIHSLLTETSRILNKTGVEKFRTPGRRGD
jgi:hypothetical protein